MLLGPNSRGSWSHWQPVRIRKMIPLNIRRQLAGGRPVGFRARTPEDRLDPPPQVVGNLPDRTQRLGVEVSRAMTQTPAADRELCCSSQAPLCKRCSSGSRIASKLGKVIDVVV